MQEELFRRRVEEMRTPLPSSNKFLEEVFLISGILRFFRLLFSAEIVCPSLRGACHGKNPKPSQESL